MKYCSYIVSIFKSLLLMMALKVSKFLLLFSSFMFDKVLK